MDTQLIRQQIHKLVDEANPSQLDLVLDVLTPKSSRYTQTEINSFYDHVDQFEANGSKGFTVADAHAQIRNKHLRQNGF